MIQIKIWSLVLSIVIWFNLWDVSNATCIEDESYCTTIDKCASIKSILHSISISDLLTKTCGKTETGDVMICCNFNKTNSNKEFCGIQSAYNRSPWLAAIGRPEGSGFLIECAGVLISNQHVLGSSDCVEQFRSRAVTHVRLGTNNQEKNKGVDFFIENVIIHPKYDKNRAYENNIAIFHLEIPVEFSSDIQPICLPNSIMNKDSFVVSNWEIRKGEKGKSGFTRTSKFKYVDNKSCNKFPVYKTINLSNHQICAVRNRFCRNDEVQLILTTKSQNLVKNRNQYFVTGIGAFGPRCDHLHETPEIFTDVHHYYDWIKENME